MGKEDGRKGQAWREGGALPMRPGGQWQLSGWASLVGVKLNKQLIEPEGGLVPLSSCLWGPGGWGSHWA